MRIVFQGDSITDCGRSRENDNHFGVGYPLLIKAKLGLDAPGKHEFLNRGVGGARSVDMYTRVKSDMISLAPDVLSILIGVNDADKDFWPQQNGVSAEKYYTILSMLVGELLEALPKLKIMVLEPFAIEGSNTKAYYPAFRKEVEKRAAMAKKVAQENGLTFVALQAGFDELAAKTSPADWSLDGLHPTSGGHEYIKNAWLKAFEALEA